MKRLNHPLFVSLILSSFHLSHLAATTWIVNDPGDTNSSTPADTTLRGAILNAVSGDTITFDTTLVSTITLTNPLPTITQNRLTITSPTPITIDGSNTVSIFSIVPLTSANGSVQLTNLVLQNGLSLGGDGGSGGSGGGGGGGAGGGGALYVHTAANVQIQQVSFLNNTAQGGNGGSNSGNSTGGGGGGFGGGSGGNGVYDSGTYYSGGGGGGNLSGGDGGTEFFLPGVGGSLNLVQSGGGGGGFGTNSVGSAQNGASACQPQSASATFPGGLGNNSRANGGGGAGAGGNGGDATATSGGDGGIGIGIPLGTNPPSFGGGGGGGFAIFPGTNGRGGNGTGTGGGGGGAGTSPGTYAILGGNGGLSGGGGGGAGNASPNGQGGQGGFGAGGGAGATGGGTLFGGGTGNSGVSSSGGGGGGAAMGGAIFVQNGGQLIIGDGVTLADPFNPNVITAGSGGATAATAYGQDLFISSGGAVIFNPTGTLSILHAIQSNQGVVGTNPPITTGGIVMNGTGILNLAGNTHTYTTTTTINQGTVQIDSDNNLGSLSLPTTIVLGSGTLEMIAAGISSARAVSLTGQGSIDTNSYTATLTGLINGSGSLTKLGLGTLEITPPTNPNTYEGGTILSQGTISVTSVNGTDEALGAPSSTVTMNNTTTLIMTASSDTSSSRSFILQGRSTLQTDGNPLTLNGTLSGPGGFTKTGSSDLWLTGTNSYSGGTTVSTHTLFGNTNSLQGAIQIDPGAVLTFLETVSGSFNGTLTGSGTLNIGDGTSTYASLQISTLNLGFMGPTNILSGATLNLNGSIANSSPVTVNLGGALTGTGISGPLTSNGTVKPGNSVGTLTVQGNLNLGSTNQLIIELEPTQASRLIATGTAAIDGTLTVDPAPGFYGFGQTFTILSSSSLSGTFNPPTPANSTSPNFIPNVTYTATSVILDLSGVPPFFNFFYANPNEESVGNNINALAASGSLSPSSPFGMALASLTGLSDTQINEALDQMHPAPFSAFAEIQASLGAELLSIFHRRIGPNCECQEGPRVWAEPYGHWLQEANLGYQLGFHSKSQGVAAGLDLQLIDGWTFGIGGAWNDTHMKWNREQGFGHIRGYYGAAYTDFSYKNFYMAASCLAGFDTCKSTRHLHFSTIDEQARAKRHNTEILGQFCLALSSGPSNCFTFPYINLDYFYLHEGKAKEKGAPGLNLELEAYTESTIRVESGFILQGEAQTEDKVFCLSPLFNVGWAMETPLHRPSYRSTFEGQTIPFRVTGWDYTWQLLTVRLGLTLAYRCLSLYGGYTAEVSPLPHTPYFAQRANARLNWNW